MNELEKLWTVSFSSAVGPNGEPCKVEGYIWTSLGALEAVAAYARRFNIEPRDLCGATVTESGPTRSKVIP